MMIITFWLTIWRENVYICSVETLEQIYTYSLHDFFLFTVN